MSLKKTDLQIMYKDCYGEEPPSTHRIKDLERDIGKFNSDDNTLPQIATMHPHKLIDYSKDRQEQILESDLWVGQRKLDGVRLKCFVGKRSSRLDTRKRSELTCLYIEKTESFPRLASLAIPTLEGTVLDGELIYDSNPFIEVTEGKESEGTLFSTMALMSALPENAITAQEQHGEPAYRVYDIIYLNGRFVGANFHKRFDLLKKIFDTYPAQFKSANIFLEPVTHKKRELYELECKNDAEGIILRRLTHLYSPGKVVRDMLKWKRFWDIDVFITGSVPGKKLKYIGQVGSLELSVFNELGNQIVIGHVPPGTDIIRKKISMEGGKLNPVMLNKVVSVRCMGFTPKLLMRHTALLRYRPDKTPTQCVLDTRPIKAKFRRWREGW